MKYSSIGFAAMISILPAWSSLLLADPASPPRETIAPAFREILPNVPGKSLVGSVVSYPPGGATPAHHRAPHLSSAMCSLDRSEARWTVVKSACIGRAKAGRRTQAPFMA